MGAPRGGLRDEAMPAASTRAEHVEERDERAGSNHAPFDVQQGPSRFEHAAAIDVSRNDRVRDAGEAAVVEMHVGPADLGRHHLEDRAAGTSPRRGEPPPLERPPGSRHHDGFNGLAHYPAPRAARTEGKGLRNERSEPIPKVIAEPIREYQGHAILSPSGNGIHRLEPSHRASMKTVETPTAQRRSGC